MDHKLNTASDYTGYDIKQVLKLMCFTTNCAIEEEKCDLNCCLIS